MKDRALFKTNTALLSPQLWCLPQQFFLENKSLRQKIKQMPWTSDWHTPTRGIFTWENCSTNILSIWDIFQLSCLAILFPPHSLRCTVEKQTFNLCSGLGMLGVFQMLNTRSIFLFFQLALHNGNKLNIGSFLCIKEANLGRVG